MTSPLRNEESREIENSHIGNNVSRYSEDPNSEILQGWLKLLIVSRVNITESEKAEKLMLNIGFSIDTQIDILDIRK